MAGAVGPGEFSGEGGLVQKAPHELTPSEEARLMRATDESVPEDTPEAALAREWGREGRL